MTAAPAAGDVPLDGLDRGRAHVRFSARAGGVSCGPYASLNLGRFTDDDPARVQANHGRLRAQLGLDALAELHQVHGRDVLEARADGSRRDADGHVTREAGVGLLVLAADCMPVALLGEDRVGMLHAGWPGLDAGVLEAGVDALGGPDGLSAVIGPCAGPCCYEVQTDVGTRFGLPPGPQRLDLRAVATQRLRAAGVERVDLVGGCTMHEERFFSHRADGPVTGRQGGVAWLSSR